VVAQQSQLAEEGAAQGRQPRVGAQRARMPMGRGENLTEVELNQRAATLGDRWARQRALVRKEANPERSWFLPRQSLFQPGAEREGDGSFVNGSCSLAKASARVMSFRLMTAVQIYVNR